VSCAVVGAALQSLHALCGQWAVGHSESETSSPRVDLSAHFFQVHGGEQFGDRCADLTQWARNMLGHLHATMDLQSMGSYLGEKARVGQIVQLTGPVQVSEFSFWRQRNHADAGSFALTPVIRAHGGNLHRDSVLICFM